MSASFFTEQSILSYLLNLRAYGTFFLVEPCVFDFWAPNLKRFLSTEYFRGGRGSKATIPTVGWISALGQLLLGVGWRGHFGPAVGHMEGELLAGAGGARREALILIPTAGRPHLASLSLRAHLAASRSSLSGSTSWYILLILTFSSLSPLALVCFFLAHFSYILEK